MKITIDAWDRDLKKPVETFTMLKAGQLYQSSNGIIVADIDNEPFNLTFSAPGKSDFDILQSDLVNWTNDNYYTVSFETPTNYLRIIGYGLIAAYIIKKSLKK